MQTVNIDPHTINVNWTKNSGKFHSIVRRSHTKDFIGKLFAMEPRIRIYDLYGDLDENHDFGYIPTKEFIYVPVGLPDAAHEVGHMLDCSLTRITKVDFGFGLLQNFTKKGCEEASSFFKALAYENRAIGIQNAITGDNRKRIDSDNTTWSGFAEKVIPFGRFRSIADVKEWSDDITDSTKTAWSKERIMTEWKLRLDHLRNWMETSDAN